MIETKYYCDRCKKEIKGWSGEYSEVKIESEYQTKSAKGPYGTSFIHHEYLFDGEDFPTEFILCHSCAVRLKKYLKGYWKEIKS